MKQIVRIMPGEQRLEAEQGENLLEFLRRVNLAPEAPCGGHGTCGKCRITIETSEKKEEVLACQTWITQDLTVYPAKKAEADTRILETGWEGQRTLHPIQPGFLLAFDIGTTTIVCYLLSPATGEELAHASMLNPQTRFGADVISRIQYACKNPEKKLTYVVRQGMQQLIQEVCEKANITPEQIGVVSVVANPCMQQLFLGMKVDNLASVPFPPIITHTSVLPAADHLPSCTRAKLLIIPEISGYVGADTLGCIISTQMDQASDNVLLVDIGTNGEMVLSGKGHMTACSTAAGPALEGAKIHFGMRGAPGAIDHVTFEIETKDSGSWAPWKIHTIGDQEEIGICGSGLIDAAAVMKKTGILNQRGRIQTAEALPEFGKYLGQLEEQRVFYLTEKLYLTQQDIREIQMAKGAIAAGIQLMAEHLGISLDEIDRVLLAGAFGSFMDPDNACEIGLLPLCLKDRIAVIGNAAGSGAKMLACNDLELQHVQSITQKIEFLELASLPQFQKCFARNMNFL